MEIRVTFDGEAAAAALANTAIADGKIMVNGPSSARLVDASGRDILTPLTLVITLDAPAEDQP